LIASPFQEEGLTDQFGFDDEMSPLPQDFNNDELSVSYQLIFEKIKLIKSLILGRTRGAERNP
jgi:hypothetical protein